MFNNGEYMKTGEPNKILQLTVFNKGIPVKLVEPEEDAVT
jgi:hypothetical protein